MIIICAIGLLILVAITILSLTGVQAPQWVVHEPSLVPTTGADDLHAWWGLSYANYLTVPRTVMQSMPNEWQAKMATLLYEMGFDWMPEGQYYVQLRDAKGRFMRDPLADYERGRRRL
jgi:hypothetical protein